MNVHLVSTDTESDQVLARLARDLMTGLGWTAGERPRKDADLNVFFPYLHWWNNKAFNKTRTAAWFTHRDTGNQSKSAMWEQAARAVTLRLTSARMYAQELLAHGPTEMIVPPVDHARFIPGPKRKMFEPPRVGLSGMVYPGGRKGEELVEKLAQSDLGRSVTLIASGEGWPVPTYSYGPGELADYFRSLDVFLCTSTIEGIPLPPLEALACGIPIVIPRGVGLLDELPDAQNIFRYNRGDQESMEEALRRALVEPVDVGSLTGIAARFTTSAWCQGFSDAAGRLINGEQPITNLAPWRGRAGVYYVAYGDPARECARRAIRAWQLHMPGIPAALVSDTPLGVEDIFIENKDEDIGARSVKTKIYELAPSDWEYVLYMDADTELVAPVGFLFDLLVDGWEFVICTNPAQYHLAREMRRPDNQDEIDETIGLLGSDEILQLNGGVFGFRRCDASKHLITRWHQEWLRWGKRDQAALDRALYDDPVRVYVLCKDWNLITRYDTPRETTAVCHYPLTARRWRGVIKGRLDGNEAWAAVHPEPKREPPPRE